jgi:aryl-alcohol dehydrogenase (NADP+)
MLETDFRTESIMMATQIKAHAAKKGLTPTQFAVAWLLRNKIVSSVIGGPRTLEQWTDYMSGASVPFDEEDEALIDSLVKPGHASTPGYNDPQYPFYGRIIN